MLLVSAVALARPAPALALALVRLAEVQLLPLELLVVEMGDGLFAFVPGSHLHVTEAARGTVLLVSGDGDGHDLPIRLEELDQRLLFGRLCQITHVYVHSVLLSLARIVFLRGSVLHLADLDAGQCPDILVESRKPFDFPQIGIIHPHHGQVLPIPVCEILVLTIALEQLRLLEIPRLEARVVGAEERL